MATQVNDFSLKTLRDKLRVMMNDYSDHVGTGGCADIEEYRRTTGIIEGLALAERELLDLDERLSQD